MRLNELVTLTNYTPLIERVSIAVAIAIEDIKKEDANFKLHPQKLLWAKEAIVNIDGTARNMMWMLLARFRLLRDTDKLKQITDEEIQTTMTDAINALVQRRI